MAPLQSRTSRCIQSAGGREGKSSNRSAFFLVRLVCYLMLVALARPAVVAFPEVQQPAYPSESDIMSEGDEDKKERRFFKGKWLPIPMCLTEPAFGYGLGLALGYIHPREGDRAVVPAYQTPQSVSSSRDTQNRPILPVSAVIQTRRLARSPAAIRTRGEAIPSGMRAFWPMPMSSPPFTFWMCPSISIAWVSRSTRTTSSAWGTVAFLQEVNWPTWIPNPRLTCLSATPPNFLWAVLNRVT